MQVLIIGVSRIVTKRILPALGRIAEVERIHIASRREIVPQLIPNERRGQVFNRYSEGLTNLVPCVAYISLPNSLHSEWVERALDRGFHVVVDKPSFTTLKAAETMLGLATKRRCCLAEANVWSYHPQVEIVKRVFQEAGGEPTRISAVFSFPPLDPSDFRYVPALGGGSLFDLGPYAVSCGRVFFGRPPTEVTCRVASRKSNGGVDSSFSLLTCYSGEKTMIGHFGFNTEYKNWLSLLGPGVSVDINRAFTSPADMTLELVVRRNSREFTLTVPAADSFQCFLEDVLAAVKQGEWSKFTEALLADAECLHRIRVSAGEA